MSVPRRFEFHDDASCNIQPEGLISENFVQCDPGTPGKAQLGGEPAPDRARRPHRRARVDHRPVPHLPGRRPPALHGGADGARAAGWPRAARTSTRSSCAPTRRSPRCAASPATSPRQKDSLDAAVRDTDRVVAALAQRKDSVTDFIEQADRVSRADRRPARAAGRRDPPPAAAAGRHRQRHRQPRPAAGQRPPAAGRAARGRSRPRARPRRDRPVRPGRDAGAQAPGQQLADRPAHGARRHSGGRAAAALHAPVRPGGAFAGRPAHRPARCGRHGVPAALRLLQRGGHLALRLDLAHPARARRGQHHLRHVRDHAGRGLQRVLPPGPDRGPQQAAQARAPPSQGRRRADAAGRDPGRPRGARQHAHPRGPAAADPQAAAGPGGQDPAAGPSRRATTSPTSCSAHELTHRQPERRRQHALHQPRPGRHDDRRRAAGRRVPLLQRQQGPAVRHHLPAQREGARRPAARRGLRGAYRRLPGRPGQRDRRRPRAGQDARLRAAGDEARRDDPGDARGHARARAPALDPRLQVRRADPGRFRSRPEGQRHAAALQLARRPTSSTRSSTPSTSPPARACRARSAGSATRWRRGGRTSTARSPRSPS